MSNPEEIFSWRKLVEFLRYNECRWNLNWIWKLFCNKFSYKYGTIIYFFIICFKTSSWKYSKWNLHMSIFIEIEYNLVSKFDTHHYVIWKFQVKIWHNHFSYNYNFFFIISLQTNQYVSRLPRDHWYPHKGPIAILEYQKIRIQIWFERTLLVFKEQLLHIWTRILKTIEEISIQMYELIDMGKICRTEGYEKICINIISFLHNFRCIFLTW